MSGRGVGMDVVKRNIQSMGGHVEITSVAGRGTTTRIVLPLTLAILDGMSVKVGNEIFILPLNFVMESLQPSNDDIYTVGNGERVVRVRGEYLPLVALHEVFSVDDARTDPTQGIVTIMETEGRRFAMLIDELVGQQQVVVKNLETNYRKVHGISAATILGDGSVALIVDVAALNRETRAMHGARAGAGRDVLMSLAIQPIGANVSAEVQMINPAAANAATSRRDAEQGDATGQEFLVFTLGDEEYGIDILKVQEIRGYDSVTRIANAPEFIKGVINLRGIIVPIVDMRIKFHLGRVEYDHQTVVIILNVAHRVVGMVVDGVSDVLTLQTDQIMPAPEFGATLTTEYLTGLGTVDGRMLILMDIEKLMSSREMALIETLGG